MYFPLMDNKVNSIIGAGELEFKCGNDGNVHVLLCVPFPTSRVCLGHD